MSITFAYEIVYSILLLLNYINDLKWLLCGMKHDEMTALIIPVQTHNNLSLDMYLNLIPS